MCCNIQCMLYLLLCWIYGGYVHMYCSIQCMLYLLLCWIYGGNVCSIQCMLYLLLSWIYGGNKFCAIRFTWLAIKLFILLNNCEGKKFKFQNQRQILPLSSLLHISYIKYELCNGIKLGTSHSLHKKVQW